MSDSFSFYLRNDDRVLDTVGKGMLNSKGLMGQLQKQSSMDLLKEEDFRHGRAGGKRGYGKQNGRSEGSSGFARSRNLEQTNRGNWHGCPTGRERGRRNNERFQKACLCFVVIAWMCAGRKMVLCL